MTPKQSAIRKAWIESIKGTDHNIDIIMECADKNGWVHPVGKMHGFNASQMNLEVKRMVVGINGVRPIALQGIENNRGWTRIDGPGDLPKRVGKYLFKRRDNKRNEKSHYHGGFDSDKWHAVFYSHWRPVEEIPEPVY